MWWQIWRQSIGEGARGASVVDPKDIRGTGGGVVVASFVNRWIGVLLFETLVSWSVAVSVVPMDVGGGKWIDNGRDVGMGTKTSEADGIWYVPALDGTAWVGAEKNEDGKEEDESGMGFIEFLINFL